MITSQVEALRIDGDVDLAAWQEAGLLHPSLLRMAKVATLDGDLVDGTIGRLTKSDLKAARTAFQRIFASWLGRS